MHSENQHHKQNSAWPCCLSSLCWWDEDFLCRGSLSLLPSVHSHSVCLGVEGQKRGKLSKMADTRQRGITPADSARGSGSGGISHLVMNTPPAPAVCATVAHLKSWQTPCSSCLFFFNREHRDEVGGSGSYERKIDVRFSGSKAQLASLVVIQSAKEGNNYSNNSSSQSSDSVLQTEA